MIRRIAGFLISILIHIIILSLLIIHVKLPSLNTPKSVVKSENIEITFIPLKKDSLATTVNSVSGKFSTPIDPEICKGKDGSYVGVGLTYMGDSRITSVPAFYPAYKAGIRVGDKFLDFDDVNDGYVSITVKRNFDILKFHIKTEKICYRGLDN